MEINYHKWLELEITNSYFKDSVCSELTLVPFKETAQALTNYNILLQKTGNLTSFYCGTTAENFNVTTELSGLKELYFQVFIEDRLFLNYTDITSFASPALFLFQNSKNSTLLQKQKFVSSKDIVSSIQFGLPNKDFIDFNTGVEKTAFGVLKLDLDLGIKTATEAPTLTLDFKARDVYFQYLIILPDSWDREKTSIQIEGSKGETYPNLVPKQLKKIGEKTAEVITSNIPIALAEEQALSKLKISYTSPLSNMENELELKLPNPNPETVKKLTNEQGDTSFYSTVVVYV